MYKRIRWYKHMSHVGKYLSFNYAFYTETWSNNWIDFVFCLKGKLLFTFVNMSWMVNNKGRRAGFISPCGFIIMLKYHTCKHLCWKWNHFRNWLNHFNLKNKSSGRHCVCNHIICWNWPIDSPPKMASWRTSFVGPSIVFTCQLCVCKSLSPSPSPTIDQ